MVHEMRERQHFVIAPWMSHVVAEQQMPLLHAPSPLHLSLQ
jgi:hypothetical protein